MRTMPTFHTLKAVESSNPYEQGGYTMTLCIAIVDPNKVCCVHTMGFFYDEHEEEDAEFCKIELDNGTQLLVIGDHEEVLKKIGWTR